MPASTTSNSRRSTFGVAARRLLPVLPEARRHLLLEQGEVAGDEADLAPLSQGASPRRSGSSVSSVALDARHRGCQRSPTRARRTGRSRSRRRVALADAITSRPRRNRCSSRTRGLHRLDHLGPDLDVPRRTPPPPGDPEDVHSVHQTPSSQSAPRSRALGDDVHLVAAPLPHRHVLDAVGARVAVRAECFDERAEVRLVVAPAHLDRAGLGRADMQVPGERDERRACGRG